MNCFHRGQCACGVCAGLLQSALTVSQLTGLSADQAALNGFLVNQFEANGECFPTTRENTWDRCASITASTIRTSFF